MAQLVRIKPKQKIKLTDFDAGDCSHAKSKAAAETELESNLVALADLSYRLYAEHSRSLLIVLQGMDTAGKDGAIRHVTHGLNPQVCRVTSFKQPSSLELGHDFLWRIHAAVPPKGYIGIFNRSQYEDVLPVRVHNLVPEKVWSKRYAQINHFERTLAAGGTKILKFFLHVSADEQKRRLEARLQDPDKRWKFSKGDIAERKFWDDYQAAYEAVLSLCSTKYAPWFIVPANYKWYRNLLISRIVRKTLEKMDPRFPPAEPGLEDVVVE